jgi:integrase/recombinase XerD
MTALPVPSSRRQLATLDQLAAIPEEEIWLAKQKSRQTRRAYRLDVRHFMRAFDVTTADELRQVDHRAVIAWERMQREQEGAAPSTVRRRLAALSSLFKHLVRHGAAARNPVVDVERPTINRTEGSTAAFSKIQARKLLDAPPDDTLAGLRDRAILSVGLQVGFRRAEIAALNVGDLHQNRGFDALRVIRKGGRREALAINPQAAQRIRAYLEIAGHGNQMEGPLFRPVRGNKKPLDTSRRMDADAIDRMVRKYAAKIGLPRGYSAHSMRATFITTALENGAQLEDVQKAAGHRDPSTTKLYDRRGYNPEKAASFFATY